MDAFANTLEATMNMKKYKLMTETAKQGKAITYWDARL